MYKFVFILFIGLKIIYSVILILRITKAIISLLLIIPILLFFSFKSTHDFIRCIALRPSLINKYAGCKMFHYFIALRKIIRFCNFKLLFSVQRFHQPLTNTIMGIRIKPHRTILRFNTIMHPSHYLLLSFSKCWSFI